MAPARARADRSRGVDLGAAVLAAKDNGLLVAGGGHAMAAGLTVAPGGIEPLRAFLHERMAADVEQARGQPGAAARCIARAGRSRGGIMRCARCRRTLWRGLARAPRRCRPGPAAAAGIVGNGHVRAIACGDDGRSFKLIAFRAAETELGQAMLSSPADKRWWLAGTIKRDEWNGGNAAEMHLEDAAPA